MGPFLGLCEREKIFERKWDNQECKEMRRHLRRSTSVFKTFKKGRKKLEGKEKSSFPLEILSSKKFVFHPRV